MQIQTQFVKCRCTQGAQGYGRLLSFIYSLKFAVFVSSIVVADWCTLHGHFVARVRPACFTTSRHLLNSLLS